MSTSDTAPGTVTLRRLESAPPAAHVRHVDELSEYGLEQFLELVETGATLAVDDFELTADDVIVFTEYYCVERA